MGFLSRLWGAETRRDDRLVAIDDPRLVELFGLRAGALNTTADAVLSNLAVAARCVALRSELLASVPLFLFRRDDNGGRERADDNPLYGVLHDIANPLMSSYELRELLVRSLDLSGNFYARIERNARGQCTALWPLHDVTIERLPSGRLRYKVYADGQSEVLLAEECLHIRGPSRDGITGLSLIAIARGSLGLALAHQETAHALSNNALQPSAAVSFAERLTAQQRTDFLGSMQNKFGGAANAGKLLVVDGGAKFDKLAFSPEDAELLNSRKLSNEDVARVFNVPPTAVGILDKATYSNVEQESRSLVQNCIGPLAGRIESALQRCLLGEVARRTLYVEFDLDGLLRGDVKSRFEAYRIGREIGAFSPNDIRRLENQPPIADGDTYHMPGNWVPLSAQPASEVTRMRVVEHDDKGRILQTESHRVLKVVSN
jgi:HK97 family phage portal protein